MGRAPDLSSRVKQACRLLNFTVFASVKSRSENKRQRAMLPLHTHGFSMRLNQPMNRVASRRGMRLLKKKLMSSCWVRRAISDLAFIWLSFVCNRVGAGQKARNLTISTMYYVIGGVALAALLRKLYVRLQLSVAKHRSLAGHARMSRR